MRFVDYDYSYGTFNKLLDSGSTGLDSALVNAHRWHPTTWTCCYINCVNVESYQHNFVIFRIPLSLPVNNQHVNVLWVYRFMIIIHF